MPWACTGSLWPDRGPGIRHAPVARSARLRLFAEANNLGFMLSSASVPTTGWVRGQASGLPFCMAQTAGRVALMARSRLRSALALALLGLLGCPVSSGQQAAATLGNKRAELSCPRETSERIDVGSWRGTGRPDVARVFVRSNSTTVLSCREVDLNGDGRKDMLVFFLPDGRKLREEFDHDYDGTADVKSYYEGGQLVRQELDVNYDGKPDLLQHFEGGRLSRTEKLWEGAGSASEGAKPDAKSDAKPDAKSETKPDAKPDASTASPTVGAGQGATERESSSTPPLLPADATPRGITPALPPASPATGDAPSPGSAPR